MSQHVTTLQTHSIHMVSRGTASIRSCLIFVPKGEVAYVALSTGDFDFSFLGQVTRDESASNGF